MGFAKRLWMEEQARGWGSSDKNVCADCFEDPYLKTLVQENLATDKCDYCLQNNEKKKIAAPLDSLMKPISSALRRYFEEPGSAGVPRDDGEWVDEERFTYTEAALLSLPLECEEKLFRDIASSFHNNVWIPCAHGSWLGLHPHEELLFSWRNFVETVTHRSRYFFSRENIVLLRQISTIANSLKLVKVMRKGILLYRVRSVGSNPPNESIGYDNVGPPPESAATAGRMNPAGISYFYLAKEKETAFAEMIDRPPCKMLLATFKSEVDLFLLDLTHLPEFPSIFDEKKHPVREALLFVSEFAREIAKPVIKDGREHVDYVPSQIVSEYFSQVFQGKTSEVISGIIYPSAVRPQGKNIVLFPLWRSPATRTNEWKEILPLNSKIEQMTFSDWDKIKLILWG
jgi:RES domain-containing protein